MTPYPDIAPPGADVYFPGAQLLQHASPHQDVGCGLEDRCFGDTRYVSDALDGLLITSSIICPTCLNYVHLLSIDVTQLLLLSLLSSCVSQYAASKIADDLDTDQYCRRVCPRIPVASFAELLASDSRYAK